MKIEILLIQWGKERSIIKLLTVNENGDLNNTSQPFLMDNQRILDHESNGVTVNDLYIYRQKYYKTLAYS